MMKDVIMNLGTIVVALGVYFGVIAIVPKLFKK